MKTKFLILTLLLSTATFLVQCRVRPPVMEGNVENAKMEVAKKDSIPEKKDSIPEKKAPIPEKKDSAEVSGKGQAETVVPQGEPHKGFVYVSNIIPDLVVDLRYFTTNNFMGMKVDGYEANVAILSKAAAVALSKAADELREKGYVIKVYDAYRPQKAVDHFVRWAKTDDQRNKQDYYPNLAKANLFPTYIARKSGHSRGSTIDMTICYKNTGEEVDMGGHFDYFGPPSHPSFTGKYPGGEVTQQHKQNRMMLRDVMVRHGFKPYDNEWWHFTLKNEPYPSTFFVFPVK